MSYVVECQCGHIFVTKNLKTQCKCGRRFHASNQPMSLASIEKNSVINELKKKIEQQQTIIKKFIQNFESNHEEVRKIIKEFHDL